MCDSTYSTYSTYRDGSYWNENDILKGEEFKIVVGLYTDEFEVSNPLGTSKKKHKMSAVYWVIANVPSKYRSTLHSIQLALLCKAFDVKKNVAMLKFSILSFKIC